MADRLIDAIFDRFELLVEQPRMGRNRPEFGDGVRSFVVESYVIYPFGTLVGRDPVATIT
jgi:plasmid stabilization system protein ParE